MQRLQNIFKRIVAAVCFFTRLPLWRIVNVEKKHYERLVPLWPLAGWLTGGLMALVLWLASLCQLPITVCVILALMSRLMLTGGLHEDGFADFCDGFGGKNTKDRTLSIMKDSHIGTYGVIGLIMYYLLIYSLLTSLFAMGISPWMLFTVDALCKYMASTIIYFLPYARTEENAKNGVVYAPTPFMEKIISFLLGLAPLALLVICGMASPNVFLVLIPVAIVCAALFWLMHRRIQGYTGDCCGATFIIAETTCYLSLFLVFA